MNEDWKENPELKNMDKSKLDMLQQLADQGVGKNPSDMLPFLMEAASRGKKNGLNFSQPEISAILDVLKEGKNGPYHRTDADDTLKNVEIQRIYYWQLLLHTLT